MPLIARDRELIARDRFRCDERFPIGIDASYLLNTKKKSTQGRRGGKIPNFLEFICTVLYLIFFNRF